MKNILFSIISGLVYFGIILFLIIVTGSTQIKRYLYSFPDGYIANTDKLNSHMLGYNIHGTERLPEMKIMVDSTESNLGYQFILNYSMVLDFIQFFLLGYLYFLCGIWFLLRVGDLIISTFFLSLSLFFSSFYFILGLGYYIFIFYFVLFELSFLLLHLSFRLKGKDLSTKWILPEIVFCTIFSYIGYTENESGFLFYRLLRIIQVLLFLSSFILIGVGLYDFFKYRGNKSKLLIRKSSLAISISIFILSPLLIYSFNLIKDNTNIRYFLYLIFSIFPLVFTYSSLRYSFIKQQLYFNSSVSLIYLSLNLILFYIIFNVIFYYLRFNSPVVIHFINGIFLAIVLFYASSIKTIINELIDYWTFGRNIRFSKALEDIARMIGSPMTMKSTAKQILQKITEVLQVERVIVLVPGDKFPGHDFRDMNVLKVTANSSVWEYFSNNTEITITSYLAYGSGNREIAYKFLSDLRIQIAYPIIESFDSSKVSTVFLIGEKKNNSSFSLGELKFIKECTRLGDLLLQNYLLLLSEVEKKKMERDLVTIQIRQKTANPFAFDSIRMEDLDFGYMSLPAVGISGDYIDFVKTTDNKLLVFLGDVSGHGVGSGFLVSAVKALIHDQVSLGVELPIIFKNVNTFLIERYAGNEFMSLIAGIYDPRTSIFEYINAGHLTPFMYRGKDYHFRLRGGDRVLGVLPTTFTPEKIQFGKGDRLFLYSDGVTETFNSMEIPYGEKKLLDFIKNNFGLDSVAIVSAIVSDLDVYRQGADLTDDISLICLTKIL
jgi:hypothetical protein